MQRRRGRTLGSIVESMGSLESGDERKERLVRSWTLYNVRTNIISDIESE
jgi:hypothetical protein